MASAFEDPESECRVFLTIAKTPNGFLRAVGVGYCIVAGLLSQLNEKDFIDCLKTILHKNTFPSDITQLQDSAAALDEQLKTYREIIELVECSEIQEQVELVFTQLFQQENKSVQDPLLHLEKFLRGDGPPDSLSTFAVQLRMALSVQLGTRNCQIRGTTTGAYVRVEVSGSSIHLLLPTSFENMLESKRLEDALYENFDSHFNRAMVGFSKALATVDTAPVECILPHSKLRSQLLEIVKYDLTLEVPRAIVATKFTFKSRCGDCEQQQKKVRLDCGHWKCKECVMVAIYNQTQYHHLPECLFAFELTSCCTVAADDLLVLLSPEEIEALHLELLSSPAA